MRKITARFTCPHCFRRQLTEVDVTPMPPAPSQYMSGNGPLVLAWPCDWCGKPIPYTR
jgi:hypothetical protein